MSRTLALAVVALSLGIVGCGSADEAASKGPSPAECRREFDKKKWLANKQELIPKGLTARQKLADALIRCRALDGLKRSQVRRLLGPPEPPRTNRSPFWEYNTGPQRGVPIDSESLAITFKSDRVSRVELTNT